jgi:hypothetical protein
VNERPGLPRTVRRLYARFEFCFYAASPAVVAEVEAVELGIGAVRGEVDCGLDRCAGHEGVVVQRGEPRRQNRAQKTPRRRRSARRQEGLLLQAFR